MNRIFHMTTPPERQTSAAPIKVINPLIPGDNKGSANLNMDIAKVQSNSVTMNQYLPMKKVMKKLMKKIKATIKKQNKLTKKKRRQQAKVK